MAGWLMVLAGRDPAVYRHYAEQGVYGTILQASRTASGGIPQRPDILYTLADYASMRPGDLIFFFTDRLIYGVGQLVSLDEDEPTLCNWSGSDNLKNPCPADANEYLWTELHAAAAGLHTMVPWLCTFEPAPSFFEHGVDMDYVLGSAPDGALAHLRMLSGRTFFKMEDNECRAMLEALLRRNRSSRRSVAFKQTTHARLSRRTRRGRHLLDPRRTVEAGRNGRRISEAAVQVWLVHALARGRLHDTFGAWSYIGNLEAASPLKPWDYVDKMDVFGYSLRSTTGTDVTFADRFKVIELKGDKPSLDAARQAMKYVDWLSHERAAGDYSQVKAFLIAPKVGPQAFGDEAIDDVKAIRTRNYVEPVRPYARRAWASLKLVLYEIDRVDQELTDLRLSVAF